MAHRLLIYHPRTAERHAQQVRAAGYPGPIDVAATPDEALALAPAAEILLAPPTFPAEALAAAGRLRWIQSMWAGVERWLALPLPPGVLLTRMVGAFGPLIAEYVFAHLLAHGQHLARYRQQQADRVWKPHLPRPLRGRCLGVAGLGSIGGEVARLGKAFGMAVWGLSRSGSPHPWADRVFTPDRIAEWAAGVDVAVITLPHTPATAGLIGREVLAAMRSGAILINVGRGAVVDEGALVEALQAGRLELAVLDVFQTEPLPPDHPFWLLPNCVVTPHCSGPSLVEDVVAFFMANYWRFAGGQPLEGLVDRERGY